MRAAHQSQVVLASLPVVPPRVPLAHRNQAPAAPLKVLPVRLQRVAVQVARAHLVRLQRVAPRKVAQVALQKVAQAVARRVAPLRVHLVALGAALHQVKVAQVAL